MLSLPLLTPQTEIWHRPTLRPRSPSPPPPTQANPVQPTNAPPQAPHQTHRTRQATSSHTRALLASHPLTHLAAAEHALNARKHAIATFGAHWIRPPGVPKTLQAMHEEEAERRELEEAERQERGLADLAARQAVEEMRLRREGGAVGEEGEEGRMEGGGEEGGEEMAGMERDLDDEVPEAEVGDVTGTTVEDDDEDDDEDEDEDDEEGGRGVGRMGRGDVTFNEDSIVEGSRIEEAELQQPDYAELEAELNGAAQDEEELGIERNLDDSIPEAGSYQHTDTEMEDTDSDSDVDDTLASVRSAVRSARQQHLPPPGISNTEQLPWVARFQDHMRSQAGGLPRSPGSLLLSSSLLDSSQVNSSPVTRANPAGRGRGGRRGG